MKKSASCRLVATNRAQRLARGRSDRRVELEMRKLIHRNEKQSRLILDTSSDAYVAMDLDGRITDWNRRAETMFGWPRRSAIGRLMAQTIVPARYRKAHRQGFRRLLASGKSTVLNRALEVMARHRDGREFPVEIIISWIRLQDASFFAAFLRDITQRRRMKHAILEVSERERRSVGMELHDGLCQHLIGVVHLSHVLEQKLVRKSIPEAAEAREVAAFLRSAITEARRLARGLYPVKIESVGLASSLKDLADSTGHLFRISCVFSCPREVALRDHAKALHLYRIAQEAVQNAVRHGQSAKILIGLSEKKKRVILTIVSDGKGYRAPPRHGKVQGDGIGLDIMNHRAQMIGASLDIRRGVNGCGAVVTCSLRRHWD